MNKTEAQKLREIVERIDWQIENRKRALDIHTARYKKFQKGGSKEGEDHTSDPHWEVDHGWIQGASDTLTAWETAKGMIIHAFPEAFPKTE